MGTRGGTFPIFSTVKHKESTYFLTADKDTNALYTGKKVVTAVTGQAASFKKRFDFFKVGGK